MSETWADAQFDMLEAAYDQVPIEAKARIAELEAKVDELNKKWANANMRCAEANAEAERWRQKASAATLDGGECENANYTMKSGEIGFRCSECGSWDDDPRPKFCHGCGKAVER